MMVIMESDYDEILSARYYTLTKILDDFYTSSYEAHKSGQLMGISRVADEAQCNEVNSPMDDDTSRVAEKNIRCNGAPIHLIR